MGYLINLLSTEEEKEEDESVNGEIVSTYDWDGEDLGIGISVCTEDGGPVVREGMIGFGVQEGTYKLVRVDE